MPSRWKEGLETIALNFLHVCTVERAEILAREDVVRLSLDKASSTRDQHRTLGVSQGMVGIVGGKGHRGPCLREGAGLAHDLALIAEIEARRRLVEDHDPGLLRQGTSNQGELALAAGDHRIGSARQMRGPEAGHGGMGNVAILQRGARPNAAMRAAPHQHHVLDREGERACMDLRHVSNPTRPLADRYGR